ncbi:MAG: M4 family metallopeptidase [Geothrix sp.]|uniref:M4 family metallopeptidase n=1 Tax=Geothrix sp. TaxID=1962974 RepID=UPI00181A55C3|nr:M4 family metallopeptidase [Geothrix sp.]NWJ41769.1 M4 family metallopeptidase [Geothrix sp.]
MATTKGRLALSFVTAALAAGSLFASSPQETLRVNSAAERLHASRAQLGLDADHAFSLRTSHSDDLGQTHGHFTQLYKGVRVWGGDAITHTDRNGADLPLTNALHKNILLNVTPSLASGEALAVVQSDLSPKGAFSYVPTTELVVFPQEVDVPVRRAGRLSLDQELSATEVTRQVVRFVLAYHVHTELENDLDGIKHTDYMVDAHTGAILKQWNTLHTSAAVGTGNSQYNGVVSLNTNSTTSGFEMRDMTRGSGGTFGNNVVTNSNHASTTSTATGSIYTNTTNTWGDGANYVEGSSTTAANGQTAAVDAMFGMAKSWDFYLNVFGRNGIDGSGTATYSRVHVSNSYDNAFWSDTCFCMTYGDGSSFTTLTAIDVAGHEMSHGVCARTANLTYSGESGGLNESNSDIFGTMIEFYSRGGSGSTIGSTGGNWTIGEQLASTPLRYMYKPSLDGASPDAWSSSVGSLDVHYSSGPMNRCFYFLSQGATTTGNTSTTYLPSGMTGVGNDAAARIWFRALSTYLTASSNYAAARTASISAAKDLYGAGSAQEQAVWNAFHGINVGAAWTSTGGDTTAPTSTASESGTTGTITLSATATDNVGVTKVEFYIDGALVGTSTTSPYSVTYNSANLANGTHSLVAKAYDAAGNVGSSSAVSFSTSNTTTGTTFNEVESNNTRATANVVGDTVNKIVGYMSSTTDIDYFKVNVQPGKSITVNMTGPSGVDYDLYFLNSSGTTLKSSLGSTATESITYSNTSATATVFYIKVIAYAGSSTTTPYNLALTR